MIYGDPGRASRPRFPHLGLTDRGTSMQPAPMMQQARTKVANAFALPGYTQGQLPPAQAAPPPQMGGYGQSVQSPAMTQDTQGAPGQVIMKNTAGGPVYYGTPQARQLALQGLRQVVRGYGWNHPRTQAALQAAIGVLGPDWQGQIPSDYFKSAQGTRTPGAGFGAVMP